MSIHNLTVLVTGGSGFIGSNIVEYLLLNGVKKVRVLDNLSTGHKSNIQPFLDSYDNIEFVWGDINNIDTCRKVCQGIDVICHQAALGSVPRSIADPLNSHNSNVNGFVNILIAAKENGIKRVAYASSSSVYGTDDHDKKVEDVRGSLLSPYAVTKYIDELYGHIFTHAYGMECIGLRYFNIYGPRQDPNGAYAAVIPRFINMLFSGKQPTINGDGSNSRDFTYVDNAVSANVLALTTANPECFGTAFNVGTDNTVSVLDLFNKIRDDLGVDIEPIFGPERFGDIAYSRACIDKIKNLMGYKPLVLFDEGIERTIEYFSSKE